MYPYKRKHSDMFTQKANKLAVKEAHSKRNKIINEYTFQLILLCNNVKYRTVDKSIIF